MLGPRADIWIACARYPGVPPEPDGPERRFGMAPAMTWRDPDEDPEDQVEIAFHVARFDWAPGSLDRLFDEVAEDLADALLFSPGRAAALAPYAGGFDVFLPSAGELDRIEARHADWMSDRPDRL